MRIAGIMAFAAAATLWLGLQAPASAAQIPPGSYRESCTNISANFGVVNATCPDISGTMDQASLNYSRCAGSQVANNDGRLVCGSGGFKIGRTLPRGSWRASCRNASESGSTLFAQCDNGSGGWTNTSLNLDGCPTRLVGNSRGNLFCESTLSGGILPPGNWRNSCRDAREDGRMLFADCDDGNGNFRNSSVDTGLCPRNEVVNTHGRLYCRNGEASSVLPPGSWRTSCRNGFIQNGILHAECLNGNGAWVASRINLRDCRGAIGNVRGNLVCMGRKHGDNDGDNDDGNGNY